MGLFGSVGSAIGGALSSVGSAICSGISSVCSGIGGALFSGAGGIAALACSIIRPLTTVIEIGGAIDVLIAIVSAIAEALGLKDKDETSEELGMKAETADKKPEDFDSIEAYIEYLRNDVQIDKEKLENLSKEDKVKYAAIGTAITIKGIEEKYGIEAPGDFWKTAADLKLSGEETKQYIETFKQNGITNMKDMSDYIKGVAPESGTKPSVVSDSIMAALKQNYPELSEEELVDKFNSLTIPGDE